MSNRLCIAFAALAFLILANIGWRMWAGRGLITIDVDKAPLSSVIRSIEKQGGIRLVSNAGSDATVTMHVHHVPLVRALQVLSINTGGTWSAGYIFAPEKSAIQSALDDFTNGADATGWKKFALQASGPPGMPGMPGMGGASDPRADRWEVTAPSEATLQAYLEQGSQIVNAQFWVPEQWNPPVATAPAAGLPAKVAQRLASAGHGQSAEVFLLTMQAQQTAGDSRRPQPGVGFAVGPPSEAAQKAMAAREQTRIARLPSDQRVAALAKFDERKKFFDSLAQLSPEERQAKIREHMEADMNSAGPSPMETRMTQFDAMHTAEQRANFFRMVLQHKQEATGR